jgi:hypothetical protein
MATPIKRDAEITKSMTLDDAVPSPLPGRKITVPFVVQERWIMSFQW